MKNNKVLWVQNPGRSDVILGDLGVKVPAGKTINIFKWNPYLTDERVKQSMDSGSLKKRLDLQILKIVNKFVDEKPSGLDVLKQSKEAVRAKKLNSSVVIDSEDSIMDDEGQFNFADYGVTDALIKHKKGAEVLIDPKNDAMPTTNVLNTPVDATDPMGKVAEVKQPDGVSFVVASSPSEIESVEKPIVQKVGDSVVVGNKIEKRSLRKIKKGIQDSGKIEDDLSRSDAIIENVTAKITEITEEPKQTAVVMDFVDEEMKPKASESE